MTSENDIINFDGFRTIEASDTQASPGKKPKKSLFWENDEARDIEQRLGITHD